MKLSWPHRLWFCATFLFGISIAFALPVCQTNDEDSHWRRIWTISRGDVYCHTIPEVANDLPKLIKLMPDHKRQKVARWSFVTEALKDRGYNIPVPIISNGCGYFPLGYIPAGIVARLVAFNLHARPRTGGMIKGFYAARLTNWLMLTLVVFLLLRSLPWARSLILFFYSIPEVHQQASTVGLDSFLFSMTACLLILLFTPPRWRSVAWIALVVAVMTMTKPIYAPLALLAVPLIARLKEQGRWTWRGWVATASLLLPAPLWVLWSKSIPPTTSTGWAPGWVNPGKQVAYLGSHPWHVLTLLYGQLENTWSTDLMHGRWTGIFGAFGWSAFEMHPVGYYALLGALTWALLADWAGTAPMPVVCERTGWKRRAIWSAAVAGPVGVMVGAILAMYLYFSRVGAPVVNGVQGRYYLVPLLLLFALFLYWLRRTRPAPEVLKPLVPYMIGTAAFLCMLADALAVHAIRDFYWIIE